MGPDAMIFVFWKLRFKPTFSLSTFTFIKKLFSSSSLSAIRVVSSVYLRLLIFLPAILIPACVSSSPVFLMMYSAYKLNKQGDNIQPWRTSFPIWNQSVVTCPVLTVASWPAYKFLKKQIRWSGIPILQYKSMFLPIASFYPLTSVWNTQSGWLSQIKGTETQVLKSEWRARIRTQVFRAHSTVDHQGSPSDFYINPWYLQIKPARLRPDISLFFC